MLTTILFSLLLSPDTCVFRPVDRDSLRPKVEYFQEQYDAFTRNDHSEYQLIYITSTKLVYVNINENEILMLHDDHNRNTIQSSHVMIEPGLRLKFKNVIPGYYLSSCKGTGPILPYFYLIKYKNRVIFSYHGYNKDIQEWAQEHDELSSVLDLLNAVL
jgi:hypothetical protein